MNNNHVFAQSSPTSQNDAHARRDRDHIAFTYTSNQASYNVAIADNLILTDLRRQHQIPIKLSYPEAPGNFPVIIFSHGTGASKDDYAVLTRFWASKGYICIQPTHADSIALKKQLGNSTNFNEAIREIFTDFQGWKNRAADISCIISALNSLELQVPDLKDKIDTQRIGVAGHSYGAYTAQLIGGVTIDIPGKTQGESFTDPQVRAILLLSPPGSGQQGLTHNSWENLKLPMMTMTGSRDRGVQGQGPEWKEEAFKYSPAGDKYLVFIQGATHFSFSGGLTQGKDEAQILSQKRPRWRLRERFSDTQQQEENIFNYVKVASVSFWDTYLKQDSQAKNYLKSDGLNADSNGDVSIFSK